MSGRLFQLHPPEGPPPEDAPNEILPSPTDPMAVARILLEEQSDYGHLLLRYWRGEWWKWVGPHWVEAEPDAVRKWLYLRLENAQYQTKDKDGQPELKRWAPDKSKLDKLLDAMVAPCLLPRSLDAPCWLSTGRPAAGLVPCENGLVDVTTQAIQPVTPDYFGTIAVPLKYDPDTGPPTAWMAFLRTIWPSTDGEEIRALQEWFGYVLSGRLDLQKILLVVGPPRSGKGTIARILRQLVGKGSVAAPTLAGMATNFGMQPLLGKSLAIVGDARLQTQGQEGVVERLLSISGQDSITVDRKNRDAWTGTVPARIMILSNELPKFGDASGAISSRMIVLKLQQSFLGREDIDLDERLLAELPAILKWALDGLVRLNERRRFTEPEASQETVQELADLVSPIQAFLREVCVVGVEQVTPFSGVYREYQAWCEENGRGAKNSAGFSSDLHTVIPDIRTDHRPYADDGRKLPRHIKGLSLNPEWTSRVREWKGRS